MIGYMRARLIGAMKRPFAFPVAYRLLRQQDGTAAIEFGLVAVPFFALIFAIMETALVFFVGQTLETAGSDSARLIMTGQAQAKGLNKDTFKEAVCDKVKSFGLFDCTTGLAVDVQKYSQFSDINLSTLAIDEDGKLKTDGFVYQPGGPGEIVVVRVMYQWPVYVSLLGLNLSDMAGGKRLLMSTSAFRNEPYL